MWLAPPAIFIFILLFYIFLRLGASAKLFHVGGPIQSLPSNQTPTKNASAKLFFLRLGTYLAPSCWTTALATLAP
jgi:hypothetical protein